MKKKLVSLLTAGMVLLTPFSSMASDYINDTFEHDAQISVGASIEVNKYVVKLPATLTLTSGEYNSKAAYVGDMTANVYGKLSDSKRVEIDFTVSDLTDSSNSDNKIKSYIYDSSNASKTANSKAQNMISYKVKNESVAGAYDVTLGTEDEATGNITGGEIGLKCVSYCDDVNADGSYSGYIQVTYKLSDI
ncbi:MAG: hypothetical protein K6B41_10265 [Butyrivibrio sp.]|nr:hypothetical protein [Butyrivibrio sp.]